jgi:tRNA 2-thiouridine synthesizing protein E
MSETMYDVMHPGSSDPEFPHAPVDWDRASAAETAREEGLSLTGDHWETVRALQEYFSRTDKPNVRELHDALDEHFHGKGGIRFLYEIFPGGPVAQGARIAGLEPPPGSVDPSFGSVQ